MKQRVDFAALNARLLQEALTWVTAWLPGGRVYGCEYVAASVQGGRGRSFSVNLRTGRWIDHATGERGHDLISLYAAARGLRQIEAALELLGLGLGSVSPAKASRQPMADPAVVATKNKAAALRLWRDARPAAGTVVEAYLRRRGITAPIPATLRFHPRLKHPSGVYLPTMIAAVQAVDGTIVGIHRTFLRADGTGKADVEPNRLMLGACKGGAVRFAKAAAMMALTEGIETGLSVAQECPGLAVWAALSTSGLRAIEVPACVQTVIICADHDAPGKAAMIAAALRFTKQGRIVKFAIPPNLHNDFNDLLAVGTGAR